jgi:hypothetical protein
VNQNVLSSLLQQTDAPKIQMQGHSGIPKRRVITVSSAGLKSVAAV